jgi:hypothetical protein
MAAIQSFACHAHHGMNDYDTSHTIELHGQVVGYKLLDPHSLLLLDVATRDGVVSWQIEGGRAAGIVKAGLSRAYLDSKPDATIQVYQSKDESCLPNCRAIGLEFDFDDNNTTYRK